MAKQAPSYNPYANKVAVHVRLSPFLVWHIENLAKQSGVRGLKRSHVIAYLLCKAFPEGVMPEEIAKPGYGVYDYEAEKKLDKVLESYAAP